MNQLGPGADSSTTTRRSRCCSSTTAIRRRRCPISTASCRGLEREDLFTVVFDQVMTDTALYADVVLPATTFLEGYDFAKATARSASSSAARSSTPSARRARTPTCSASCARRLGLLDDDEPAGELDLLVHVLDAAARRRSATTCATATLPAPPFGAAPIQFVDVFPNTPDRKVRSRSRRRSSASAPLGPVPLSARSGDRRLSAGADLAGERADDQLDARRAAAARRQAADASRRCGRARAGGRRPGAHLQRARRSALHAARSLPTIRPGTVSLPKGLWRRSTRNGFTGTALVPDTLTDLGGGACFNDARVQVASLATALKVLPN